MEYMDGFVGRVNELDELEKLYKRRSGSCAISGRRHMGKTSIISKFCEDKKHIYLCGTKGLASDNYRLIVNELSRFAGRNVILHDIIDLFPTLVNLCGMNKVIVVLDRYSVLKANFPVIDSQLKDFMVRGLNNTHIMLVVADEDSAIFDRFYINIDVKKMGFRECAGFHPDYTPRQNMMVYSIVGGVPVYHSQFVDDPRTVMRTKMFDPLSFFSLEAEGFFNNDSGGNQFTVMSALASGAYNSKMVSDKTRYTTSVCNKVLEDLYNRDILVREEGGRFQGHKYFIGSYLLKFYFEVVNKYSHVAEYYGSEAAFDQATESIMRYLDGTFKEICIEYVDNNYDVKDVSRIRGRDLTDVPKADFCATVFKDDVKRTLYAICRLDGAPVGMNEFGRLKDFAREHNGTNRMYALFSGCGFTEELIAEEGRSSNIKLMTLEMLYE